MNEMEKRELASRIWMERHPDGASRSTGKTTSYLLERFSTAIKRPGKWVLVPDDDTRTPPCWLLSYARHLARRLQFRFDWRKSAPGGYAPGTVFQIKFEVRYARRISDEELRA